MSFPKPKDTKQIPLLRPSEAVHVYSNGREVCNLKTAKGRRIYKARLEEMWRRQGGMCGLRIHPECKKYPWISLRDATFEHVDGRGMGGAKRDDRIVKDGKPYNLAACALCNQLKGSRTLEAL